MEIIALILSVLLGVSLMKFLNPKPFVLSYLLTFSGAYLLSVTILHLLPEVYSQAETNRVSLYVLLGLLIQMTLDYFSKGIDHGHIHSEDLKAFPIGLFLSLILHSFMEGLAVSDHHNHQLLWAIVIHKIPITMVLVSFLLASHLSLRVSIVFLIVFALMSPLGVFFGDKLAFFLQYKLFIDALVAGAFLHIATTILSESSRNHKFKFMQFLMLIFGVALAYLI